jgi:hypothetical protein
MSRYRMADETVVDTDNAMAKYEEATDWNGQNHISRPTGSQWDHETLYRSTKSRWYIEHTSQWEGKLPSAEWVTAEQAAAWLALNEHPIPPELAAAAASITE